MPKFELDHGTQEAGERYRKLDAFTQGYIEALFFTETPMNIPGNDSVADLSEEAWQRIERDCMDFQDANSEDLDEAVDNGRINGYDLQAAGRDFWYSRNGHGTGYFARNLGTVGDVLQKNCQPWGEVYPKCWDDGKIYLS